MSHGQPVQGGGKNAPGHGSAPPGVLVFEEQAPFLLSPGVAGGGPVHAEDHGVVAVPCEPIHQGARKTVLGHVDVDLSAAQRPVQRLEKKFLLLLEIETVPLRVEIFRR